MNIGVLEKVLNKIQKNWIELSTSVSCNNMRYRFRKIRSETSQITELLLELELTNSIAQIVEAFLSRKVVFICSDSAMN